MSDRSVFRSRQAILRCTPGEFYGFITDVRNFRRLIPEDARRGWVADNDKCSFEVPSLGLISLAVRGKIPFSSVEFTGNAMGSTDFTIKTLVDETSSGRAGVVVTVEADLNPLLKMMVAGAADKFMEVLADEMEKMEDWSGRSD